MRNDFNRSSKGELQTGLHHNDGMSAYEIAVELGFQGDEPAWLLSLQGQPGNDGIDGTKIRNGAGVPSNALGANGDYYINDTNSDYYLKVAGVYVLQGNLKGLPGDDGDDGSKWRNGAGVPSNALGVNGDYYLNDTNSDYYLKVTGAYVLQGNLKGIQGAAGSTWRNGAGVPANGLGANGDYYLNDTNSDYYLKVAGVYVLQGNLKGLQGDPGTPATYGKVIGLIKRAYSYP